MRPTTGQEIQPGTGADGFFRVFEVEVGVALRRPPRTDEYRKYLIVADRSGEAELHACQWAAASPGVVMPTSSRIVSYTPEPGTPEPGADPTLAHLLGP